MKELSLIENAYVGRLVDGRSYDEIATERGVSANAVRQAITRARRAIGARTVYQLTARWATASAATPAMPTDDASEACRVCGCTQERACHDPSTSTGGCYWVAARQVGTEPICNVCVEKIDVLLAPRWQHKADCIAILRDLVGRRAFDLESAVQETSAHGLRHSTQLHRRGLVESEFDHGTRRMTYWATPLGRELAR